MVLPREKERVSALEKLYPEVTNTRSCGIAFDVSSATVKKKHQQTECNGQSSVGGRGLMVRQR
jgi:hypothetical protein